MTELAFEVTGATPDATAMTPILGMDLRITASTARIQSIVLRCQVRIEPERRRYAPTEERGLRDLFGEPERWSDTLTPFLLTHVTLPVRGFTASTEVTLPLELSYDLEVAAGKYLHALQDGEIPLLFLFSGTVFVGTDGGVQVEQIPWEREARYRLPVEVWDRVMDLHFPGTGWLRARRDTIDALQAYKSRHALATWDDVLNHLLASEEVRT